jgi:CheY-like chemotaxis protein
MPKLDKPFTILLADDDPEDCLLIRDALKEVYPKHNLQCVRDGEELLDYLCGQNQSKSTQSSPRPDLILLDMKMPRMDGREVLRMLKSNPLFRQIPVVALTTSTSEEDVAYSYDKGINSYITKPVTYRALVDIITVLCKYWFEVVELPPR